MRVGGGAIGAPAIDVADAPSDAQVTEPSNGVRPARAGGRRLGAGELDL